LPMKALTINVYNRPNYMKKCEECNIVKEKEHFKRKRIHKKAFERLNIFVFLIHSEKVQAF